MKRNHLREKSLDVAIILMFIVIAYLPVVSGYDNANAVLCSNWDGAENNKKIISYEPTFFEWGVDQKNTKQSGYGITLHPPQTHAQSFTPTKHKLTAVSLYLLKGIAPPEPVHIRVSIRDNLTGSDLVTKIIDTSVVTIKKSGTWVIFDFEDISITPENTYYIVCSVDAGDATHSYCWFFANNDTYSRGEAWFQSSENDPWITWPSGSMYPVDFCFKTYFRKPFDSSVPKNNENLLTPWLLSILERFHNAFPVLRHIIGY